MQTMEPGLDIEAVGVDFYRLMRYVNASSSRLHRALKVDVDLRTCYKILPSMKASAVRGPIPPSYRSLLRVSMKTSKVH